MNFLAIVIAAIASMIAYGQYRTARQKLVLDLFEKRSAVYEIIRDTIQTVGSVEKMGTVDREDIERIEYALYQMDYLFGSEVIQSVQELSRAFKLSMSAEKKQNMALNGLGGNPADIEIELNAAYLKLYESSTELSERIRPYMLMDHKLPRSLSGWVSDNYKRWRG